MPMLPIVCYGFVSLLYFRLLFCLFAVLCLLRCMCVCYACNSLVLHFTVLYQTEDVDSFIPVSCISLCAMLAVEPLTKQRVYNHF